jgi:SAM-dependent methyltransferase
LGVDWPNAEDVETRHAVMLGVIGERSPDASVRLLDFGCGASHLYEHIIATGIEGIEYSGLDLSQRFVDLSRSKFPGNDYYFLDILDDGSELPRFDYVVMNGVLTEKVDLSFDEMFEFTRKVLRRVFAIADVGIAFNVMSKHVDWEREDLFHLPFDMLAQFLTEELTRRFVIRSDYGLYEYTVYAYRDEV